MITQPIAAAPSTFGTAKANHALVKNYGILGLHWNLYASRAPGLVADAHRELTALADAGAVQPVIGDIVPFERAPEAIQKVAAGETVGRLVVSFAQNR